MKLQAIGIVRPAVFQQIWNHNVHNGWRTDFSMTCCKPGTWACEPPTAGTGASVAVHKINRRPLFLVWWEWNGREPEIVAWQPLPLLRSPFEELVEEPAEEPVASEPVPHEPVRLRLAS